MTTKRNATKANQTPDNTTTEEINVTTTTDNQTADNQTADNQTPALAATVTMTQITPSQELDEDTQDLISLLEIKVTKWTAEIGSNGERLDALKSDLANKEQEIKAIREEINKIAPLVGDKQTRINQARAQIEQLKRPISLTARRGGPRPVGIQPAGTPSPDVIERALSIYRACPPVFGNQDVQAVKGCPGTTAGGILKKHADLGIISRLSPGEYKISDDYVAWSRS